MQLALLLKRKWIAVIQILFILFGIYITVQILIKVFGGSWSAETLRVTLGVANITCTITMATILAGLKSDHRHLVGQVSCMATDFKRMSGQFSETRFEVKHLSEQFKEQKAEIKSLSSEMRNHSSSLQRIEQTIKRRR